MNARKLDLGEAMRYDLELKTRYTFYKRLGVPVDRIQNGVSILNVPLELMRLANQFLDKQEAEMQELKKPIEEKLSEISSLKANVAALETDNAQFNEELEKLKHDTLTEQNKWAMEELRKANQEIATLKAELEKQTPLTITPTTL